MLIVFLITIILIMSMMFGVSYAWYAYSNAETNIVGTTLKEKPTVIFTETEYIKESINMPIKDEDRYNYANKSSFNITLNENLIKYETAIQISLIDIHIAEELKNINYKYELTENNRTVSTGDFSLVGEDNKLEILPTKILSPEEYPETYKYNLYIWLTDDNTNQNHLMSKKFSAKINVNSMVKK